MIKREFQAKMVNNFRQKWIEAAANDESTTTENIITTIYDDASLVALHDRISGETVTMLEMEYPIGENDFFEKIDNDFVMYSELWTEIKSP